MNDEKNDSAKPTEVKDQPYGIQLWAKRELEILERGLEGRHLDIQREMTNCVMALMEIFSKQGHSGMSASYCINTFFRLAKWKPLTPLTGEDDEWMDISFITRDGKGLQQNKRCYSVFRENKDNATAYDIDAVAFSSDGGHTWFSSGDLRKKYSAGITFPYFPPETPRGVYIKYTSDDNEKYIDITDDKDAIKELFDEFTKKFDDPDFHKRNKTDTPIPKIKSEGSEETIADEG